MGVAKRVDSDATAEVEISVAVIGNQPRPLAAIKDNVYSLESLKLRPYVIEGEGQLAV